MDINKYTEKAQEAIVAAQQLADREGHPEITPEHLLLTLVEQQGGIVPEVLRKMNVDPAALGRELRTDLTRNARVHGGSQPTLSVRLGGEQLPPPRTPTPSPSDLLSAELDRFARDPIYEDSVRAAT